MTKENFASEKQTGNESEGKKLFWKKFYQKPIYLGIIAVFLIFLIVGNVNAAVCTCSDCITCNNALNNTNCDTVNLIAEINSHVGTCINDPANFNNKIFDCQGYTIDGDDSEEDYGIYLDGKTGNTIKNCIVTDFYYGILLSSSSNNNLTNNTANSNAIGIYLNSSSNNNLTNNTANSNAIGIYLYSSSNNILTNNTANNNWDGISLSSSSNNTLANNTANSNNNYGILLYSSSNNNITNNTANSNTKYGIYLVSSSNNTLTNNTANSNTKYGIYLLSSSNNNLTNNTMNNNTYNFNINGGEISDYYQDIDTSNLVDNKPIYYWTNEKNAPNGCKNTLISELNNTGFVALISCDNITVKNLNLTKNYDGILLVNTTNSKILNNAVSSNYEGIYLYSSSNNTITNNTANLNTYAGISLYSSSDNTLKNNTASSNNNYGFYLHSSSNNNILTNNTVNNNNGYGIYLRSSSNNILTNNTANDNKGYDGFGIYLYLFSNNNTLTNNTANNNNYGIYLSFSSNNNLTNNTANNNTKYGIYLYFSSNNNNLNSNLVCGNTNLDIEIYSGIGNSGDNRCNNISNNGNAVTCSQNCSSVCFGTLCNGICYTRTGKCCTNTWYSNAKCCNNNDCNPDEWCGGTMVGCIAKKSNGVSCVSDHQCLSNNCNAGTCMEKEISENCKSIIYNGNISDKIDVVFVGSGFPNLTVFEQTVNEMIDYNGTNYGLMSVEPFKSNRTRFNFWMVNTSQTFTDGSPKYDSQASALVKQTCPFFDEMIALYVTPRFRSHAYTAIECDGNWYWNWSLWWWDCNGTQYHKGDGARRAYVTVGEEYINNTLGFWNPLDIDGKNYGSSKEEIIRTTVHEFGHSFGGLHDEYSFNSHYIVGVPGPLEIPNCDNSPCNKWNSSIPGSQCIPVCGYTDWYRAYDNTIMGSHYSLDEDFYQVNERELNKDLNRYDASIGGTGTGYSLTLTFENGTVNYKNLEIVEGQTPNIVSQSSGDYLVNVTGNNGTIYQFWINFNVRAMYTAPKNWFDENGTQIYTPNVSEVFRDENLTEIDLFIPYIEEAKTIIITDKENSTVLLINLNKATDIFDAVEMLEYLSENKNLSQNRTYYKFANYDDDINLPDIFALIHKIVTGG